MSVRAWRNGLLAALPLWGIAAALALTIYLLWHWLITAAILATCARLLAHLAGYRPRRRPKSSWAALLRSLAMCYAAWNSRWLKPRRDVKAKRRHPVGFSSNLYPTRGRYESNTEQGELPDGF